MQDDITSCIYRVPIFHVLPERSVERLERVLRHDHYGPGETVMPMGEMIHSLVVVARGRLRLSRINQSGREQVVRELGPGDFYGELALFTEVKSEGELSTVEPTTVCLLERSALQAELRRSPEVAWPLVEAVARRLSEAERTIGEISLLDVGQRLAAELLRLAEELGTDEDDVRFRLPVTWAHLATKIGTTPESLSRRLQRMGEDGYVRVDGREVAIKDVEALRRSVDGW